MTYQASQAILMLIISLLVFGSDLQADPGGPSAPGLADRVIKHTLANGLTVLLVE